jgi:hypothetical protein
MTYQTPLYPGTLKEKARALRKERAAAGVPTTHAAALEHTAKEHGFRDWNTACAVLSEQLVCPVALGQRVTGAYLKQKFTGTVLGTQVLQGGALFRLKIHFDAPVDVVSFDSFSCFRQRVVCRVDAAGISPDRTSDDQPHMRITLDRAKTPRA